MNPYQLGNKDMNDFLNSHGDSLMIGGLTAFIEQCVFVNATEAHSLYLAVIRAILVGATGYIVVELLKKIKSMFNDKK